MLISFMMGGIELKRRFWAFHGWTLVLLVCLIPMYLCGIITPAVTLLWQHDPGPYSYNVYESTNLSTLPQGWILKTNVTGLSVHLLVAPGTHFFTVTCVDTNTGQESAFATK